jgi:cysteine synthase
MRKATTFHSPADYLNPENLPSVPLVELPASLVPFPPKERVRIFAQLGFAWPLGNLKQPAVYEMLKQARDNGQLDGVHTIVESSSGNTVFCLGILAPLFEIKRVVAIVPADIPLTKEDRLRDMGVDVRKNYGRPGMPNAIEEARELGRQEGWFHLAQYENPGNWQGHMKYNVQPVRNQMEERLCIYGIGLGTTGTAIAARETFRDTSTVVVGGICAPENPVPGLRTRDRLQNYFNWQDGIRQVEIKQNEAYRSSLEITRERIRGGPSSGFARIAVNKYLLAQRRDPEEWERLRNKDGEIVAVFICGDSFDLYDPDKYRTILDAHEFPDSI